MCMDSDSDQVFEGELALEEIDGQYLRNFRLSLIKSLSSNRTISIEYVS